MHLTLVVGHNVPFDVWPAAKLHQHVCNVSLVGLVPVYLLRLPPPV